MNQRGESAPQLLAQVARLYYERDLNQQQVAEQLGLSRSKVSRLLQEARLRGIVQIQIRDQTPTAADLAQRLVEVFGLREAQVFSHPGASYVERLEGAGALAAAHLHELLHGAPTLAISWGTALEALVEALPARRLSGGQVIQVMGGLGHGDPRLEGPELARRMAERLGVTHRYLHAPWVVQDEAVRRALLEEPALASTLRLAEAADIAVIGIGSLVPEVAGLLRAGCLQLAELESLAGAGAVGDLLGYLFDASGQILDLPFNRRVVALTPDMLRRIPVVMGIAAGQRKAGAILGALRGGYINHLFTDDLAATSLLRAVEAPAEAWR